MPQGDKTPKHSRGNHYWSTNNELTFIETYIERGEIEALRTMKFWLPTRRLDANIDRARVEAALNRAIEKLERKAA